MPLHSRRRRLAALMDREAAGESFWSESFGERARTRLEHLLLGLSDYWFEYAARARTLILEDEGLRYLDNSGHQPAADLVAYLRSGPDNMMPTVLEAIYQGLRDGNIYSFRFESHWDEFVEGVNIVLREERIAWEFIGEEMTPIGSREMHAEVVAPTLRLLTQPGWERVEAAYQAALAELASGNASDAITDAGTALQEALTLLGAEGNALGPLITSAKRKGIILGHDRPLLESLDRAATWASADRSQLGDTHAVSGARTEDAWLTIHVVGAVLLRLSAETGRRS